MSFRDPLNRFVYLFPLWVSMAAGLSLWRPGLFTWFSGNLISIGLGVIMLGMGLTLQVEDFRRVLRCPAWVLTGVALQYTIMPFLGWALSDAYGLPAPLAVGLILVACCPGGTASNVISYLARVDVALSVTMTSITTLMAIAVTPLLTAWLAGSRIEVNAWGLFFSTLQVVLIPVAAGVLLNRLLPRFTRRILPAAPAVAVIAITLIVASIIGAGRCEILAAGPKLILAVFSLHAAGFLLGYIFSRLILRAEIPARTISIEVGMQNSGLGAVLARLNFADPLVAIPSAISSLFHSVIASALAGVWRNRPAQTMAGTKSVGAVHERPLRRRQKKLCPA